MIIIRTIRRISLFLVICMLCMGITNLDARAAVTPSFGGHTLFQIPCTCTAGLAANVFFPLYLNTTVPIGGTLLSTYPAIVGRMWFLIHPGNYALGYYVPGSYPCAIGFEPYCFTLPTLGEIVSSFVGTSP